MIIVCLINEEPFLSVMRSASGHSLNFQKERRKEKQASEMMKYCRMMRSFQQGMKTF